ncbi:MAG: hypothetical protein ACOH1U_13615 [Rhodoglobus sp.]
MSIGTLTISEAVGKSIVIALAVGVGVGDGDAVGDGELAVGVGVVAGGRTGPGAHPDSATTNPTMPAATTSRLCATMSGASHRYPFYA